MVRSATRSSASASGGEADSFEAQNLLKDPTGEVCSFRDSDIDAIRGLFPADTEFRKYDPSFRSDVISHHWVCFPAFPFKIGFSYPFPPFTSRFFSLTGELHPDHAYGLENTVPA